MPLDDPLSVFWRASQATVGWVILIFATILAGNWLGAWIGSGELPELSLGAGLCALGAWCVAWLCFPKILIAFAVTALAIYVPLKAERAWLYLGAPLVNLLVWTGITASVCRSVKWW